MNETEKRKVFKKVDLAEAEVKRALEMLQSLGLRTRDILTKIEEGNQEVCEDHEESYFRYKGILYGEVNPFLSTLNYEVNLLARSFRQVVEAIKSVTGKI